MTETRFAEAPARVYWELTRACSLACLHCRAVAMPRREPDELSTGECRQVLHELARAGSRRLHLVFTGGDPVKRPDLLTLVACAADLGLGVSVAPSATLGLTADLVGALKTAGVEAMSLSLDGSSPARHDGVRGVLGCFGWTVVAARRIVEAGIPLQINTLVTAATERDLDDLAAVVARLGATRWSLFFLVPVGRGRLLQSPTAENAELMLRHIAFRAREWPFTVTTTEAPHYRRVVVQQLRAEGRSGAEIRESPVAHGFGIRDGNGIMFIAADGAVTPSGFLPLVAGNVRFTDPLAVYRQAPLFRSLRDVDGFHGRCGVCEFRAICGGSRARAWAASGDCLGEDPLCAHQPASRSAASADGRPAGAGAGPRGGDP